MIKLVDNQKTPTANPNMPFVWDLVKMDFDARDEVGRVRYNMRLQPHNGRDALIDAYQEALDLVVYLRQALYEKYGE